VLGAIDDDRIHQSQGGFFAAGRSLARSPRHFGAPLSREFFPNPDEGSRLCCLWLLVGGDAHPGLLWGSGGVRLQPREPAVLSRGQAPAPEGSGVGAWRLRSLPGWRLELRREDGRVERLFVGPGLMSESTRLLARWGVRVGGERGGESP